MYGNGIGLSIVEQFRYVDVESQVAVVRTADTLAVEVNVAHVHDALEVEQDPLALE